MNRQTKDKKKEKKEFELIKKTAEAHGTLSEELAEEKAKKSEEITKELIEKIESSEREELKEVEENKDLEENEEIEEGIEIKKTDLAGWEPKTKLGREVRSGKIRDIDEILDSNRKILEEQIVDSLINVKVEMANIGQAKGKFGGGKRRIWRQTQKKTKEGNVPVFSAMAIVGDENGHVGIGIGKAKETLPARDKAIRKAKLNIIKVVRGCSSFDCECSDLHSVPFKVEGKCGSVRVILIPAPKGAGLVAADELKKILRLAGIKDVYTKTFGQRRTTFNLIGACFDALKKTNKKLK
ncbi:MAG: hypothetical protein KatS3mg001_277 [Candidatus Pacearchaeota archaeon]|nr:MAG: hypothetical protein KatS3mg001_277 [Candidatus Pacearchaeota archaeon]